MLVWLTLPFYDFCGFRSVAVNSVYKLQFLYIYIFKAVSKLVKGFGGVGCKIWPLTVTNHRATNNRPDNSLVVQSCTCRNSSVISCPSICALTWAKVGLTADGVARSTNCVEAWHHGLQPLFMCHHPTT